MRYYSLINSMSRGNQGLDFLTDLVAYYSFDASNANDIHNGTHNGSVIGSPTFPSGVNSNCIDFGNDSTFRYVGIADSDDFSFVNGTTPTSGSISAWANIASVSAVGNWLLNKRLLSVGLAEWQFIFFENSFQFYKFQFDNDTIFQKTTSTSGVTSLNTWYHVVVTFSDSASVGSTKIYVNGSLDVQTDANVGGTYTRMNNGTSQVFMARAGWDTDTTLKHRGKLDEIAIWKNRELTSTEVSELYNAGAGKFYNTF